MDGVAGGVPSGRRPPRRGGARGGQVLGVGGGRPRRDRRAAPARRDGRRRRLSAAPVHEAGQADRAAVRRRHRAAGTVGGADRSMRVSDVAVGAELPELVVDVTPTLIVAGALASRDYQDVRHDRALAETAGAKDIFMNILTTNGFVGRFVTDWSGPDAVLKKVSIRLGAPNYPGDTMRMTGSVTRIDVSGEIEVEVRGANSLGD